MTGLFISLLNMSFTASYVIVAVLLIRLFLKRVPKVFSCIMWLPVLIRLVLPFSINSQFSFMGLINGSKVANGRAAAFVSGRFGEFYSKGVNYTSNITNTLNTKVASPIINQKTANPDTYIVQSTSGIPGDLLLQIAAVIWITGIVALLVYSIISYIRILKTIGTATLVYSNIFETDRISAPFVCGFLRPRIYIPSGLKEPQLTYILAHEQSHIKRFDYLVKPFSFMVLIVHWFNPLVWISFTLMSKDMEMSCDESVLRRLGDSIKVNYSNALLSFSVRRSGLILGNPLAFGESAVKSRIKNILKYKKASFGVAILVLIATVVLIVGFTTNPAESTGVYKNSGAGYKVEEMMANKTRYVGNNSKVAALIDAMPFPAGISRDTIELRTETQPYGLKINLNMKDDAGILEKGAVNRETLYKNAILLFSLIDNVDTINYRLIDKAGKYEGEANEFNFTRNMVEKLMGEDVRVYSLNEEMIQKLINKVAKMNVDVQTSTDKGIGPEIEQHLQKITAPGTSSNPGVYIKVHQKEYESILKHGDGALLYLLSQFKEHQVENNLRGHIIMALCKDLLGDRNNVSDSSLLPTEWYSKLLPYEDNSPEDFKAQVEDPVEQLVYNTMEAHYSTSGSGFIVTAPTILGSYEEENKLKVFATVFVSSYKLYGKTLSEEGGSIIPAAMTYNKDSGGSYTLEKYEEAKDGSYFSSSIKNYCTMPVSGLQIKGLYEKILKDYGDHSSRQALLRKNLVRHLKANNLSGVSLKKDNGELLPLT